MNEETNKRTHEMNEQTIRYDKQTNKLINPQKIKANKTN